MARQHLFHQRGVSAQQASYLTDDLVSRDRSDDDRHLCLECKHLRGAGTYRCGNARAAGLHPDLARGFVQTLQRCNGYEDAGLPIGVKVDAAPPAPPAPAPAPPAPTAPTWRELDLAYIFHHAQCPTCQSAGRGYGKRCEAGAALWRAYSECIQAPLKKPEIHTKGKP